MANKTIPQLPEQTGKTDNDLLAIVDSGETTTSKIKLSTLLSGVGADYWSGVTGTRDHLFTNFTSIDPAFAANTVLTNGTTKDSLVVGYNNTTTTNHGSQFFGNDINGTGLSMGSNLSNQTQGSVNIGYDNSILKSVAVVGSTITGSGNNPSSVGVGNIITLASFRPVGIGRQITSTGNYGVTVGYLSNNSSLGGVAIGYANDASGGSGNVAIGGSSNDTTSSGGYNTILNGTGNQIAGSISGTTILGLTSKTATKSDVVYLPNVNMVKYASLNFSGDTAAAAGGVELGEYYHDNGALRVRIS